MSADLLRIEEVTDVQLVPELARLADIALSLDGFHAFAAKYAPKSVYEDTIDKVTSAVNDPDSHVFRAILTAFDRDGAATEQVVGFTQWYVGHLVVPKMDPFAPKPPIKEPQASDVTEVAMAEANGKAPRIQTAGEIESETSLNPFEAVGRQMGNSMVRAIRGKRHIYLRRMIVHPDHQGKGIGQKLIQWGIDLADREKIVGWLLARPAGLRLYEKNGWKAVETIAIDAPGMTVAPMVPMLRQPQPRQSA